MAASALEEISPWPAGKLSVKKHYQSRKPAQYLAEKRHITAKNSVQLRRLKSAASVWHLLLNYR